MANLKKLYETGNYLEAAVLGKNSDVPEEIFIGVSSYLNLGQGQEGMDLLLSKRDLLWQANPLLTLKANFDLRFILNQFDEAYEDLSYFSNLPYVNQKVEEALRALPKTIRANELSSKSSKSMEEDDVLALLENHEDPFGVLVALNEIKGRDIEPYLEAIRALLISDVHSDVKTFALMLLSQKNVPGEFLFLKSGESLRLEPSRLGSPFALKEYRLTRQRINELTTDTSLSGVAAGLLDQYCLALYPRKAIEEGQEEEYATALLHLAAHYLGAEKGEADLLTNLIEKVLQENPPLG